MVCPSCFATSNYLQPKLHRTIRLYDSFAIRSRLSEDRYLWPDPPIHHTGDVRNVKSTFIPPVNHTYRILGRNLPKDPQPYVEKSRFLPSSSSEAGSKSALSVLDGNSENLESIAGESRRPLSKGNSAQSLEDPINRPLFEGSRFYFASSIPLDRSLANVLKERLIGHGAADVFIAREGTGIYAEVESFPAWEEQLLAADYVITSVRSGWEYWKVSPFCGSLCARETEIGNKALDEEKTIANHNWLHYVLGHCKLDPPEDRLLHYPVPPYKVPAMSGHVGLSFCFISTTY